MLPALEGRLTGIAVRVPVAAVSLTDLCVVTERPASVDDVNSMFVEAAAARRWQGIVAASDEPLVSTDYVGDRHSATIDLPSTRAVGPDHLKVLAWYDNEAGYAARVIDLARMLGAPLPVTAPLAAGAPAAAAG